uniref:Uncharacterized protein n=1 Tax=Mycena chlorophos TaxID=658473 RepID=A0ABQ0KUM7_MYCCL|nr:predicted protein [Mycena chlorophos]
MDLSRVPPISPEETQTDAGADTQRSPTFSTSSSSDEPSVQSQWVERKASGRWNRSDSDIREVIKELRML